MAFTCRGGSMHPMDDTGTPERRNNRLVLGFKSLLIFSRMSPSSALEAFISDADSEDSSTD